MDNLFNLENLNLLLSMYATEEEHIVVGVDVHANKNADLVVYDTTQIDQPVDGIADFYDIVNENSLDLADFEIDRFSWIEHTQED